MICRRICRRETGDLDVTGLWLEPNIRLSKGRFAHQLAVRPPTASSSSLIRFQVRHPETASSGWLPAGDIQGVSDKVAQSGQRIIAAFHAASQDA